MSRVLLIKNANLYDPDPKGIRDILIVDEKVFFGWICTRDSFLL